LAVFWVLEAAGLDEALAWGRKAGRRLSCVGRGASVSLTADRRKQLSGMDAAQIEGDHLWREFLGAVSDQFSMGRFALPAHVLFQNLLQTIAQRLDAVAKRTVYAT
jgi:hypothetical protein